MKRQSHYYIQSSGFLRYIFFMLVLSFVSLVAQGVNRYSVASGNWNSTSTWSASSGGTSGASVPVAGDVVVIERGCTVTVNITNAACASITLGGASSGGNRYGILTFAASGSPSLTVSGAIQISSSANKASNGTITFVSGASLIAGSITMGNATTTSTSIITMTYGSTLTLNGALTVVGTGTKTWTPSTGTVQLNATNTLPSTVFTTFNNLTVHSGTTSMGTGTTVSGDLTIDSGATFDVSTNSYALTIGGNFLNSGTFIPRNGTVNYNGADQQVAGVTYYNLTISNGGTKTLQALTTVNRTLTLNTGILQLSDNNLYVNYDVAAAITGGTFSSTNMIATDGAGYLIKNATTAQTLYPVGGGGYYSPVNIVITAGGTTGTVNVRAVSTAALGVNFVKKYWDVLTSAGGKTITATFTYDPAEGNGATSAYYKPASGSWQTPPPTGTPSFGATSLTMTGTTNITNTSSWWTVGVPASYYSYKTGNWSDPSTWTSDPGGTTQVGTTIPGNSDIVEILSGRTVTLTGNVASSSLLLTIDAGGSLDLGTYQFSNGLNTLTGQGTLVISSSPAVFPTPIATNTFVNAGGGTTEYRTTSNLPSQATYNNLSINKSGSVLTQKISALTLNGNLHVISGTFQINDNTSQRVQLTVNGNVTVDAGAFIKVGTGVTNSTTNPIGIANGGTPPFINYYDLQSHRVIIKGDFTNNGTVSFTNLTYPVYNALPPTTQGATSGFATVYFQGASNNTLYCNGTTDFYNLVLDKGTDQTFKLTIYSSSSSYTNFRLFGANVAGCDLNNATAANPNVKKALWIRTGSLVLQGLLVIPSLSEGTNSDGAASPANTYYYIPSNGALIVDGVDVVVQTTADDYREVNTAYSTVGSSNANMGISASGVGSALCVYGKLQMNNGFLSTKESEGIITTSTALAAGEIVINKGTIDAKQFISQTGGAASFEQNGGLFILRGRFQRTPSTYTSVANLSAAPLNTVRANDAVLTPGSGTFSLNNNTNVFTMSGGTMQIYDVCGAASTTAFQVASSTANMSVTGGTVQFIPTAGTGGSADVATHLVSTTSPLQNVTINRATGSTAIQLNTALTVFGDLTLTSGVLNANNFDITVGGNISMATGTTYTPGTNTTTLNGSGTQTFTINLASALALNNFTINKSSGVTVNMAGSQGTLNVSGNFNLTAGTFNDNGDAIFVAKNVYNSGLHTGSGKISLNGTVTQTIDGGGIFQNLELNNSNAAPAPVSLVANTTVNGVLNLFSNKIFNIGTYNLTIGPAGSVSATAFSNSCYIHTAGNTGDGGITKTYSNNTAFTFPVGCYSTRRTATYAYTPATLGFSSSPTTYGSITVIPVGYEHPSTTVNNQSLAFYWKIKSTGFTDIANKVTHSFIYSTTDIQGTIANYIPSLYNRSNYTWNNGAHSNINTGNNTISDWTTPANSPDFIDADYTAGDNTTGGGAFGTPVKYYSRQSGNWTTLSTWSLTDHNTNNPPSVAPGINSIVIIGGNDSIYLSSNGNTINASPQRCASLQIEKGSVLDIGNNPGCNFGMVLSSSSGNGNFRLTTYNASQSTFVFPSGDFTDFNQNLGTTTLYTTNSNAGTTYWMPQSVTSYGNLILSPLGGSNVIFGNTSINIYGSLYIRGQNADSWFCPTWNTAYPTAPTNIVAKTITIKGDLNIQGGSLIWYGNGAVAQNFVVYGNVIVAPWGSIQNWGSASNQSMSIGGSLINNTNNTIGNGATQTTSLVDFTTNGVIPVTFFGSDNASITNTTGTPGTLFSTVTVNKGTSQATSLTCNIGGTLTTLTNAWLTLQNGTFIYDRPGTTFNISTSSSFSIPSTSALQINNADVVNLANSNSSANTVYLGGKLTLSSSLTGIVYIGQSSFPTTCHNDIEYAGAGTPTIELNGGTLNVNGQIRHNTSSSAGDLTYIQTGTSAVNIYGGNNTTTTNAKLEVLNNGSFTMSGSSTLTIIRGGGGSTYGDLYLRPATSSVSGGTIVFDNSSLSGSAQNYLLDATIPLNNLAVTGRATATTAAATVKIMVNPLTLNGDLTLTNAQSIFDANSTNNINITIKGNFINNGAYNCQKNLTTFSGGEQSLSGTSVTNFYNLAVSPVTSLTINNNNTNTVNNNLTLSSGTLICGSNTISLKGDFINNANYTNNPGIGGVVLSGTKLQNISGTGTFGQLELNNTNGASVGNNITLQDNLIMTTGILDINTTLLSLGQNSNIILNGAPYSSKKMITTDGVWSNVGILKNFTSPYSGTFTYPIGTGGKYTPAVFTVSSNGHAGSIRVNNINRSHPAVVDVNNVLKYYWEVESIGLTGFTGNILLSYLASDVVGGPESSYVAAQLLTPGTNWSKATPGPTTDNVNESNHTITFNFSNSSNITGEFTAGDDSAIPSTIPQYTSNSDGNWSDKTIWTPSGGTTYPCPDGGPNGFIVTINHVVTANANFCFAYKTYINNKLKAVSPYYGNNFGSVYGTNGTLYVESAVFPAGRYDAFIDCASNNTIEYGGTGSYNVNADLYSSIPNVTFSGSGSRIMPDKDVTICRQLLINGPALDNSTYNRKLIVQGDMILSSGAFKSGTGSGATVSFAGSAPQTVGNFYGSNSFNNLEINNASGLTLNGSVDVSNNLLLTNGLITTSATNKLTIINQSTTCVFPAGGSSTSYVNGPLIKNLNQGDPSFKFPIGKKSSGLGNKLSIRATQTGTLLWTAEYFNPDTYNSYVNPLTAVNTKEYWTISGIPAGSMAFVELRWDPTSDLTPLMTQNGLSDMRIANYNGSNWTEVPAGTTSGSDSYNGSVETSNRVTFASGTGNLFTIGCVNSPKPRVKMAPTGPVCGSAGIPVSLTSSLPIVAPFTVNYTENGTAKAISPSAFPATIPTITGGATYVLTGFTYNYPSGTLQTGVVDVTPVTVYSVPTTANAGSDQSWCGGTSATLAGNSPSIGSGLWSIISGTGGTVTSPTVYNSGFTGVNGNSYTLRWTISNGTCTSYDDVSITFPLLASQPSAFTVSSPIVCQGQSGVVYTVPNDPSVTYNWTYSGSGTTIVGTTNSVTVNFSASATSGTLSVTATNGCGTSTARTIDLTVNSSPAPTFIASPGTDVCIGTDVTYSTQSAQSGYIWTVPGVLNTDYTISAGDIGNTSSSVTLHWLTSGSKTVTVNYDNSNGCAGAIAASNTTNVNALPTASITYSGSPWCPNAGVQNVILTGTTGGIYSAPAGLSIDGSTGAIIPNASTPGNYTVTYTIPSTGGCDVVSATTSVSVSVNLLWTGTVSSDWNATGNWGCALVPSQAYDAEIPDVTNKPVLNNGSSGSVNNLVLDAGSSLTVTNNSLQIAGSITNNGTLDATNGTIVYNGAAGQTVGNVFSSKKIKNLTISNASGVTLSDTLQVSGIVLVSNGNLASDGYLVLLSDATGTALIDGSGSGNVTGNVIMQRYLPSQFGYKYFSSPFQAATVNEFSDDINLSSSSTLFYKYDESRISSGWVNYKTLTNVLNPLAGYAVECGSLTTPNTIDVKGVVNNGTLSVTLYNHNNTYTKGFSLIGNPYPSPIDWKAASGWTKTNIDDAIYLFKASNSDQYGGQYISCVNGISTSGFSTLNIIPSMQGFFVHVSDGSYPVSGTLSMNNSVRVINQTQAFVSKSALLESKSSDVTDPILRLTVRYTDDASSNDPLVIYFDDNGTADFDGQLDALKLLNTDIKIPNLSTVCSNGTLLSINAMPPITGDLYTVPLGLKLNRTGTNNVTIKISDLDQSLLNYNIFINDVVAGTQQSLQSGNEFSISLAKGEYNNRFFLNFINLSTGITKTEVSNDNDFIIYSYNGKIKTIVSEIQDGCGILSIYNLSGQELFNMKIYDTGYHEFDPGLKDGIYIVSFKSGSFRASRKLFIKKP